MTGLTAYAGLTRVARAQGGRRRLRVRRRRRRGQRRRPDRQGARREPGHRQRRLGREGATTSSSDLGFDAAFNYKDGRVSDLLREAAPDGIDVYFDNVGGEHLEAAIGSLRLGGRIAICGVISVYNNTEAAPGPRNLVAPHPDARPHQGFLVGDHYDLAGEYARRAAALDRRRPADIARDVRRRHRPRGRRLPRGAARREHRQDGRPPLTNRKERSVRSPSRTDRLLLDRRGGCFSYQVPRSSLALSAGSRSWRSGSRTNDPVPCETDRRSMG